MKHTDTRLAVFLAFFLVAMAATLPLAVIWSLNTLFDLGIPYTILTWLASFVLTCVLAVRGPLK